MPDFLQPVVKAIYLTYPGDALRQVMTSSTPQYSLQTDTMVLTIWLIASIILGIKLFRWE